MDFSAPMLYPKKRNRGTPIVSCLNLHYLFVTNLQHLSVREKAVFLNGLTIAACNYQTGAFVNVK